MTNFNYCWELYNKILLLTLECSVSLSRKEINFIYTPIPQWDYTSINKQLSRPLTFQKHRCISCHRAGGFFARSNLLFAESCLLFPCNPQAQSYHELSNCKLLTSQKFASFLRTRKIAENVLTLNGRKWQSVIYDDYSCLQKVTCPQATTYGLRGNFQFVNVWHFRLSAPRPAP